MQKVKCGFAYCRFLAFLREEEERERLEEIERLKPIGTPVGSYLEYRCKAEVGRFLFLPRVLCITYRTCHS